MSQALIAAAERAGHWNLVRALLAERAALWPTALIKAKYQKMLARAA